MSYDYIQHCYGIDPVPGERVSHQITGRQGTIQKLGARAGHYVHIRFDGDAHVLPCHPTELDYLGAPENYDDDPINLAGSGPVPILLRDA